MTRIRWGIFGTGAISAKFVAGLRAANGVDVAFVASRTLLSAQRFATSMGIPSAIEGYEQACRQPGIDVIYIATPPSEHARHALMCIEAGRSVLVEKPFSSNAHDASRVAQAAKDRGVFAMEALWTRFLPAVQRLKERVNSGEIGTVGLVSGSFGLSLEPSNVGGMLDSSLGGGALAHLAPYPLSLGQWIFGMHNSVHAVGRISDKWGTDDEVAIHVQYAGGPIGSYIVSLRSWTCDEFNVMGQRGRIGVRGTIVRPHGLESTSERPIPAERLNLGLKSRLRQNFAVHRFAQWMGRSSRRRPRSIRHTYAGNGYHYQADEVNRCISSGLTESAIMPLSDSVEIASLIDKIRRQIFLGR